MAVYMFEATAYLLLKLFSIGKLPLLYITTKNASGAMRETDDQILSLFLSLSLFIFCLYFKWFADSGESDNKFLYVQFCMMYCYAACLLWFYGP